MSRRNPNRVAKGTIVLRGGKGVFKERTLIGNWQEDREILPVPSKFESPGYSTTKGSAEMEAANEPSRMYGHGISSGTAYTPPHIIQYQKDIPAEKYSSIASLSQREKKNFQSQFGSKFALAPCSEMSPEELSAYRKTWSRDLIRESRFVTDNKINHNRAVTSAFQVTGVAPIPNLPLYLSDLIVRIEQQERGGVSGIDRFEKLLVLLDEEGTGRIERRVFQIALTDFNVPMKEGTFLPMWKYFDPHSKGYAVYSEILTLLRKERDPLSVPMVG